MEKNQQLQFQSKTVATISIHFLGSKEPITLQIITLEVEYTSAEILIYRKEVNIFQKQKYKMKRPPLKAVTAATGYI